MASIRRGTRVAAGFLAAFLVTMGAANAAAIDCTVTREFYCDDSGCTSNAEPDTIEAGLFLDLETSTGELCEYSQCRTFAATRLDGDAFWDAQLTFGPSNMVLYQLEEGLEVQTESLLPTNGMLTIDETTNRFVMTEHSGATVSGYLGTCEAAPVP